MASDSTKETTGSARVTALLSDYEATAIAWDLTRDEAKKANRLFDHLHSLYKELRDDEAGRRGITALMEHSNDGVRLKAAAHSLRWAPTKAVAVLDDLSRGHGLHGLSAKYTLKAFREGTLDQDW